MNTTTKWPVVTYQQPETTLAGGGCLLVVTLDRFLAQAQNKRSTATSARKQAAKGKKAAPSKKKASAKAPRSKASASPNRRGGTPKRTAAGKNVGATRNSELDAVRRHAAIDHLALAIRESAGFGMLVIAAIIALALFTFNINDPGWSHTGRNSVVDNSVGPAGAWVSDVLFNLFGYVAYLLPLMLGFIGWRLVRGRFSRPRGAEPFAFVRIAGFLLLLVSACGIADLHFGVSEGALPHNIFGGGILGTQVAWKLVSIFKPLGTTLLLTALFFCSLTLSLGSSWFALLEATGGAVLGLFNKIGRRFARMAEGYDEFRKRRELTHARNARLRELRMAEANSAIDDPLLDPLDGTMADHTLDNTLSRDGTAKVSGLRAQIARARAQATGAFDDTADVGEAAAPQTAGKGKKPNPKTAAAIAAARAGSAIDDEDFDPPMLTNPVLKPAAGVKATIAGKLASTRKGTAGGAGATAAAGATTMSSPKVVKPAAKAAAAKAKSKARGKDEHQYPLFRDVADSGLPPLALLDPPAHSKGGYTDAELETLSRLLEVKLADFNISVEVVAVHPGPVITRFELQPEPGTKAKQITNLTQDIARSLSLVSVRVVEVIAGKSTIGLEIPNEERDIIQLSELLQSQEYDSTQSPLTLALGKNISGVPVTADLAKMPHLLVAGTTGSGKSVAVNAMLLSLLYKATPNEVRLILVDPKMLELNIYDGIPHLLTPVVTDMKEASNALRWCVGEMERRYKVMATLGVRNLAGYNRKVREAMEKGEPLPDPLYRPEQAMNPEQEPPTLEPFPMIVVVVDEFADMMMQVGKKAEELIARIAQKARAAGIHLILATQRPSVDVITGLIKANIPSRVAFQVSSRVDSRTILDQMGAESLLGNGDMLYLPPGVALPERVHGAFVDDHEVHAVVAHLREHGKPNYIEEIVQESGSLPGIPADPGDAEGEQDKLYDEAVAIVTESRRASISYVQRRLKIGYNRAARIVEDMEAAGVVTQVQSNGNREVLAPPPVSVN